MWPPATYLGIMLYGQIIVDVYVSCPDNHIDIYIEKKGHIDEISTYSLTMASKTLYKCPNSKSGVGYRAV